MLEISSEQRRIQRRLGIVEEGLLLCWLDGVDSAESETQEAIQRVGSERGGNLLSGLDSLLRDCQTANSNLVGVNIAAGAAAVTVGDRPCSAGDLGRSRARGRIVARLAVDLRRGSFGAEHPHVTGTGVEVKDQSLGGGADLDGSEVLDVVILGSGGGRAGGTLGEARGSGIAGGLGDVNRGLLAELVVSLGEGDGAVPVLEARVGDSADGEGAGLLLGDTDLRDHGGVLQHIS